MKSSTFRIHYDLVAKKKNIDKSYTLLCRLLKKDTEKDYAPIRNVMRLYFHYGFCEYGYTVFQYLRKKKFNMNITDYAQFIGFNMFKNNSKEAHALFDEAVSSLGKNINLYLALFPADPLDVEGTLNIINLLKKDNFELDSYIYSKLINCYLNHNQFNEALGILVSMLKNRIQIQQFVVHSFVNHCYIHNDIQKVFRFLKIFESTKIDMTDETLKIVVNLLCDNGKEDDAYNLILDKLDIMSYKTFNTIAATLQRTKKSYKTVELFWELAESGFIPDVATVTDFFQAVKLNPDLRPNYNLFFEYIQSMQEKTAGTPKAATCLSALAIGYMLLNRSGKAKSCFLEGVHLGYTFDKTFLIEFLKKLGVLKRWRDAYIVLILAEVKNIAILEQVCTQYHYVQCFAVWNYVTKRHKHIRPMILRKLFTALKLMYLYYGYSKPTIEYYLRTFESHIQAPQMSDVDLFDDYCDLLQEYCLLLISLRRFHKGIATLMELIHNKYKIRVKYSFLKQFLSAIIKEAPISISLECRNFKRDMIRNFDEEMTDTRFNDIPDYKFFMSSSYTLHFVEEVKYLSSILPPDVPEDPHLTAEAPEIAEFEKSLATFDQDLRYAALNELEARKRELKKESTQEK